MPKSLCLFFALICCSFSFGQNTINIKEKIIDESTKLPIKSATVYISKAKDSSVVDYAITDKLGKFDFKIKKITTPVCRMFSLRKN